MRSRMMLGVGAGGVGVGVLVSMLTTGAAGAGPAAPGPAQIGLVRLADVMNGFAQTTDLEALFRERQEQLDAENEKRQEVLNKRAAELAEYKPDAPERPARERDLLRLRTEYEVHARLSLLELEQQQRRWLVQTYRLVSGAAGAVAQARKLDAVFAHRPPQFTATSASNLKAEMLVREVLYAGPRLDITDAVLARLNDAYARFGGKAALRKQIDPLALP